MKKLDYKKLSTFIASDVIQPFYQIRLNGLEQMKLKNVIKRKNPYLFKAKNIETAGDLAKNILDAFLSSQEETIFGDLMENLAINICRQVFNGRKAQQGKFKSVDLIFKRDRKIYIVGIKSGPNWGNSDQINTMIKNFKKAKQIIKPISSKAKIIAVNGCMYGKDNQPNKVSYFKLCGQPFWELVSGDNNLYKKIIQPLDRETKKRDEDFKKLYVRKINEMTKDIIDLFYTKNNLDWDKIIEYISKK
ncbi:MAG: PmeII family type II restriction endonuclease [Candidatus Staskawiczbacteria bacterium]|nr:PmeII family type II restriction endonuclease [Candidatus Staskawiczbacteria bacterium]